MKDDTQRKVDIYRPRPGLDALAKLFMASTPETDPARQASVGYDEAASPCQVPTSADSACASVRYPSGREAALETALRKCVETFDDLQRVLRLLGRPTLADACAVAADSSRDLLSPPQTETASEPPVGEHPMGGQCIHVWALTNRSAVTNGKCSICGQEIAVRQPWRCGECNHLNEAKDEFCFDCGESEANRGGVK